MCPKWAMPKIAFAGILQRHLSVEPETVDGTTVYEALHEVFASNPRLRGYLLDDQGAIRKHVVIYLNETPIADRRHQTDTVGPDDELFVFQALSGG